MTAAQQEKDEGAGEAVDPHRSLLTYCEAQQSLQTDMQQELQWAGQAKVGSMKLVTLKVT